MQRVTVDRIKRIDAVWRVEENATLRVEQIGQGVRYVSLRRLVEVIDSDAGWEMLCELMGSDITEVVK